jgi:hypothetical protein
VELDERVTFAELDELDDRPVPLELDELDDRAVLVELDDDRVAGELDDDEERAAPVLEDEEDDEDRHMIPKRLHKASEIGSPNTSGAGPAAG